MIQLLNSSQVTNHSVEPQSQTLNVGGFTLTRRYRFWEVRDPAGELICITVYKCGGQEVIKRLREKAAL